eukprot:358721-Chlamydomonas_euryale.AAC.2
MRAEEQRAGARWVRRARSAVGEGRRGRRWVRGGEGGGQHGWRRDMSHGMQLRRAGNAVQAILKASKGALE